jgi:L-amino acid N-acyltransferase YncA
MEDISIRDATAADAGAICAIYNQGIEDRVATLETELRTPAERYQWLAARSARHPVLVADVTEPRAAHGTPPTVEADLAAPATTVASESLNRFNPRPAYDHVADLSVYVERGWRGRGVGRVVLDALVARARVLDYHKIVLAAFPFNAAGIALYERVGFRTVGTYREQGLLDRKWVDVTIMEKLL